MKETKFGNEFIKKLVEVYGDKMWKIKIVGSERQATSIPDWLFCIKGKFVAIEFKVQRHGKITIEPNQIRELNKIKDSDGIGLIVAYEEKDDVILIRHTKVDPILAIEGNKRIAVEWDLDFNTYKSAVDFLKRNIFGEAFKEMGLL